ncbi:hypothetical protein GQX74_013810 [Glossina fuscipes]|nr:hypothetical protein GQX74_013810 [Glossina fuscipes]
MTKRSNNLKKSLDPPDLKSRYKQKRREMRLILKAADEKFVKLEEKPKFIHPLSNCKYRVNWSTSGKVYFDKKDVPIILKCSPDTLLNLCTYVVDAIPMVSVYEWTIEDICRWLRNLGYRQYQNTFRDNLINGRTLLLLDASALSAINIKDFDHIRDIAGKIRGLFIYEMTKFGRRISLPPEYLLELYKLFRVRTGVKYDRVRPVDFWRHLQIVREKTPYHSHWELLERWLSREKLPKFGERFENAPRRNLYKCNVKTPSPIKMRTSVRDRSYAENVNECEFRLPSRLQCLPHLSRTDQEIVLDCKDCLPPCTCRWSYKKYYTNTVLTCLQKNFPHKYGLTYISENNQKYGGLNKRKQSVTMI